MNNANVRKHRRDEQEDKNLPLRNKLNLIFIIMTILTILFYFVLPMKIRTPFYLGAGFIAVFIKMIETGIRSNVINIKKK